MKKKIYAVVPFLLVLIFILSNCSGGISIDIAAIMQTAEQQMMDGNMVGAETSFKLILKEDPDNARANLGLSCTMFFSVHRRMIQFFDSAVSQLPQILFSSGLSISKIPSLFTSRAADPENPWVILSAIDINAQQEEIAEIVQDLETIKGLLKKVLGADISFKVYPNSFDWNDNGAVESTSQLEVDINGEWVGLWDLVFSPFVNFLSESSERLVFNEEGGDAWYDRETFEMLFSDEPLPEETYIPVFNEEDYILFDAESIRILYLIVNLELTILEPSIIYSLQPGESFWNFMMNYLQYEPPLTLRNSKSNPDTDYATETLDLDKNGTITNAEFQNLFDEDFLAFFDNPNGGADAVLGWKSAISEFTSMATELIAAIELPEIIESEFTSGVKELQKSIESPKAFKRVLRRIEEEPTLQEIIIGLLTEFYEFVNDPNKEFLTEEDVDEDGNEEILTPGVFFSLPNNFSDLKNFLPDIGYLNNIVVFPDPTFGGILEGFSGTLVIY